MKERLRNIWRKINYQNYEAEKVLATAVLKEAKLVPYERVVDSGSMIASATVAKDMGWELVFDNGWRMFWGGTTVEVGATYKIIEGGKLKKTVSEETLTEEIKALGSMIQDNRR